MYVEIKIPTVYELALARLCCIEHSRMLYRITSLFVCFLCFALVLLAATCICVLDLGKIHETIQLSVTFMLNHVVLHVACCTQAELMKAAHEEKCSLLVQYLSGSFY